MLDIVVVLLSNGKCNCTCMRVRMYGYVCMLMCVCVCVHGCWVRKDGGKYGDLM